MDSDHAIPTRGVRQAWEGKIEQTFLARVLRIARASLLVVDRVLSKMARASLVRVGVLIGPYREGSYKKFLTVPSPPSELPLLDPEILR